MISKYVVPLEQVDAVRTEHLAFVESLEQRGLLASAGRQDPPVGGVLVLKVTDRETALELIAQDPYVTAGVAEYTPVGYLANRGDLKDA
ncbi:YciI family protein [Paractinoplanes deccanensis]|nr:YciI family protein [Actinoplanes deccanensis]